MFGLRQELLAPQYYEKNRIDNELSRIAHTKHNSSSHNIYRKLALDNNCHHWYKENKHGDSEASILEVAFANLAQLFFNHSTTPSHHLVRDDEKVYGLVVKDIGDVVKRKDTIWMGYDRKQNKIIPIGKPAKPPIYFLRDLKDGAISAFFKDKNISIDKASLASCLCSSYVLEEDDLHKGNIGFYIEKNEPKPLVKFFKIDHDMMFSDSIMSRKESRVNNVLYDENSFNFTISDLVNFPDIKAGNHFWPTKKVSIYKFYDKKDSKKVYTSAEDRNAFKELKDDPDFQREKWKSFLKHILIPEDLLVRQLCQGMNITDDNDFNRIQLIKNSVMERQRNLTANLFAINEFRQYFDTYGRKDMTSISDDLKNITRNETDPNNKRLHRNIENAITHHFTILSERRLLTNNSDCALITSIRMGEYRFDESYKAFSKRWNKKDCNLDIPLRVAINLAREQLITGKQPDDAKPSTDYVCIVKNLLYHGAYPYFDKDTQEELSQLKGLLIKKGTPLEDWCFKSRYLFDRNNQRIKMTTYQDLKDTMKNISQDSNLSLKFKKTIALDFFKHNLKFLDADSLSQFKSDVNGMDPNMKFISQLRSNLWIVRMIRGVYGNSSTLNEINTLLSRETNLLPQTGRYI